MGCALHAFVTYGLSAFMPIFLMRVHAMPIEQVGVILGFQASHITMHLLLFNLATDADDPLLGFTTSWIRAIARRVTSIHVITMRSGRCDLPDNVTVYSVGKEKGYSEPRRVLEFYRHLFSILGNHPIDACFCHMIPAFVFLAGPLLKAK